MTARGCSPESLERRLRYRGPVAKTLPITVLERLQRVRFRGAGRLRSALGLAIIDEEIWIETAIRHLAGRGGVFIDVGAQHGRHTAVALGCRAFEKVISIEANPPLACGIEERFAAAIDGLRLEVIN